MYYLDAYDAGYLAGFMWEGPNGDGSLGALSYQFICELAAIHVANCAFRDMDSDDRVNFHAYMAGFDAGQTGSRWCEDAHAILEDATMNAFD